MLVSYAQNFEDLVLDRVFRAKAQGFYVDVGAGDPINDSVTHLFYERGWRGINLEPDLRLFKHLVGARPRDVNLNVAAGERAETRTFFEFAVLGHSSLDAGRAAEIGGRGAPIVESTTAVETLAELCRRHAAPEIDFLKVDAEGWERPVLAGHDWQHFRPKVIVIEATKPETSIPTHTDWEDILIAHGYIFAVFDGLNRFYADSAHADIVAVLAEPPRFLADGAVLHREVVMTSRAETAESFLREAVSQAADARARAEAATELANAAEARAAATQVRADAALQRADAEQARADAARKDADAERARAEAALQRANAEQARADATTKNADAERARADAATKTADAERARADAAQRAYSDWARSSIGRFAHMLHLHRRRDLSKR